MGSQISCHRVEWGILSGEHKLGDPREPNMDYMASYILSGTSFKKSGAEILTGAMKSNIFILLLCQHCQRRDLPSMC